MNGRSPSFDLVIQGGGLTGMALAAALGGIGARILMTETRPLAEMRAAPFDGRVTAIALGSKRMLEAIGVWAGMAGEAQPIREILVGEAESPVSVHYDHAEIGTEPLGWIVENRHIRDALIARLQTLETVEVAAPETAVGLERDAVGATVTFASGRTVKTPLVAVCEGRFSQTRERLGVGVKRWAYDQTGIVCTLRHEVPHRGRAIERFFTDGPFAMLPMKGNRSSIVWALDDALAREVTRLDDVDFVGEVAERFGDELGAFTLEGPRWHYPLILVWSNAYTAERAVLVGDAARGIHPIAGQGWNLALRDVGTVAEIVADRLRLGLDPGDAASLERYEAWRRFDSLALVAITDGINRLFANDFLPLKLARETGLALVERLPPAKRFFMRHAMGLVGDLPRLMRGEPL